MLAQTIERSLCKKKKKMLKQKHFVWPKFVQKWDDTRNATENIGRVFALCRCRPNVISLFMAVLNFVWLTLAQTEIVSIVLSPGLCSSSSLDRQGSPWIISATRQMLIARNKIHPSKKRFSLKILIKFSPAVQILKSELSLPSYRRA